MMSSTEKNLVILCECIWKLLAVCEKIHASLAPVSSFLEFKMKMYYILKYFIYCLL